MKDIGLGILDPYTVVIVLITLVFAQVVFGYQIPLDTTNAAQLFVGLVVFTGYIYAAKSILRVPVAIVQVILSSDDFIEILRRVRITKHSRRERDPLSFEKIKEGIKNTFTVVGWAIAGVPFFMIWLLFYVADFATEKYFSVNQSPRVKSFYDNTLLRASFNFLERTSVVALTFLAVLPQYQTLTFQIGVWGIGFMVLVYLGKGNFSALIEDRLLQKKEVRNEEGGEQSAEQTDRVVYWDSVQVAKSSCLVCGKTCTQNHEKVLPKICSLVCFQKWANNWEKDWCIGDGKERELLNQLRQKNYEDIDLGEEVISQLAALGTPNALWALMAMIRDCGICLGWETASLQKLVKEGVSEFARKNRRIAQDIFTSCLFTDSEHVISLAADMIYEYGKEVDIYSFDLLELLDSNNTDVRYAAIKVFEKMGHASTLVDRLGKGIEPRGQKHTQDHKILAAISRMEEEKAIRGLKEALWNREYWIRREAADYLMKKFGVEAQEPEYARDKIQCLHCGHYFGVKTPKDVGILVHKPNLYWRLMSRKSRQFNECDSCGKDLVVVYTSPIENTERLLIQKRINEKEAPYFTEKERKHTIPA